MTQIMSPRHTATEKERLSFTHLSLEDLRILVKDTQLPSIRPLPTVGVEPFLQAAYREQASQ